MNAGTQSPASQPTGLAANVTTANGLKKIEQIRIQLEDALKGKHNVVQQVRNNYCVQLSEHPGGAREVEGRDKWKGGGRAGR